MIEEGTDSCGIRAAHVRITDILPTNLPVVESNELRLDNLFLLDDSSVALLDYESVIDKEYKKRIKEEMQMTQIGQMLIDEGMERGIETGMEKIITSMLRKHKSVEDIHNDTDIPVEMIQKVKSGLDNET